WHRSLPIGGLSSSQIVNPGLTNGIFNDVQFRRPGSRKGQANMSSAVVVKLPEAMNAKNARRLGRELKTKLGGSSPFVVLDLSHMKSIDVSGVEGLLRCMSE